VRISGSLRRSGAYDLGRHASERIKHPKTAGAADIEMSFFFLCEVGALACESKDVLEMNVTSCRGRIVTSTIYTIFLEFLHYLPLSVG
jgi:hypothetical protein